MIRCIIIDDERPAREEIKYLLSKRSNFLIVGEGENGVDAMNLITNKGADVVFCDINMPVLNGIDFAKMLLEKNLDVELIFVTAYDDYAISAFELSALDYLLKPINDERFDKAMDRLEARFNEKESTSDKYKKLLSAYKLPEKKVDNLCLYREGLLCPVKLSEIIYIHSEEKIVYFYTEKGVFESSKSLTEIEEVLNERDFFKCHRSYIINWNYIEAIIPWFNRTYRVKLENIDEEIPVSRSNTNKLKEQMNIL